MKEIDLISAYNNRAFELSTLISFVKRTWKKPVCFFRSLTLILTTLVMNFNLIIIHITDLFDKQNQKLKS